MKAAWRPVKENINIAYLSLTSKQQMSEGLKFNKLDLTLLDLFTPMRSSTSQFRGISLSTEAKGKNTPTVWSSHACELYLCA